MLEKALFRSEIFFPGSLKRLKNRNKVLDKKEFLSLRPEKKFQDLKQNFYDQIRMFQARKKISRPETELLRPRINVSGQKKNSKISNKTSQTK